MAVRVCLTARVITRISPNCKQKILYRNGNAISVQKHNFHVSSGVTFHSNWKHREKVISRKRWLQPSSRHIRPLSDHASQLLEDDPIKQSTADISTLAEEIKKELGTSVTELNDIASYYFDGQGKAFRPMVVMLTARACNRHNGSSHSVLNAGQRKVAMIAEMIHNASLVHDDVIDHSDTRRGKKSAHISWGHRKAVLSGDYILSVSSMMLARIGNIEVVEVLSQVIEDLVRGEFMQLGSKENENERFTHYLEKTYKKTASLIANTCKSVAILGNSDETTTEIAYQYGRNIGLAFQLVDDLLDFVSSDQMMGKPTAADLRLGLATAPVLFAAMQHPELNAMIMRRFSESGDVERARSLVAKCLNESLNCILEFVLCKPGTKIVSNGISQTRFLAEQHSKEAVKQISLLKSSPEQQALINLTHKVLNRLK